jgi:hypothetical protein
VTKIQKKRICREPSIRLSAKNSLCRESDKSSRQINLKIKKQHCFKVNFPRPAQAQQTFHLISSRSAAARTETKGDRVRQTLGDRRRRRGEAEARARWPAAACAEPERALPARSRSVPVPCTQRPRRRPPLPRPLPRPAPAPRPLRPRSRQEAPFVSVRAAPAGRPGAPAAPAPAPARSPLRFHARGHAKSPPESCPNPPESRPQALPAAANVDLRPSDCDCDCARGGVSEFPRRDPVLSPSFLEMNFNHAWVAWYADSEGRRRGDEFLSTTPRSRSHARTTRPWILSGTSILSRLYAPL